MLVSFQLQNPLKGQNNESPKDNTSKKPLQLILQKPLNCVYGMSYDFFAFHSSVLYFEMCGSNVITQDTYKFIAEAHRSAYELK